MNIALNIRDAEPNEFDALGRLLVEVYANLDGFPSPADQPHYYEMPADIGRFSQRRLWDPSTGR